MKQIPLHDLHVSLGGKMVPFAGYEMPVRYSSDKEEHLAVRRSVGVFDVSHMGEFLISGNRALELIQLVTSNDAARLADGQAQYSCLPNDRGGIVDDLIVYKMKDNEYMLVVNASNIEKDWNWIQHHNTFDVEMKNVSEDTILLAVQGPKAKDTLQKLTDTDLSHIKFYHFTKGILAGHEMIISGTGYTGAGGFELYFDKKGAKEVWEKIFEAGEEFNIKPIGLGARDTLRLEMGFCLYGNDLDDSTSPLEAGLGWITKFTKEFIHSDELLKQKEEGVKRRLVGFEMTDKGIARHGHDIVDQAGKKIGHVTSGTISPILNKGIGMGYINVGSHEPGTEIFIPIRNKNIAARISKPPFLK